MEKNARKKYDNWQTPEGEYELEKIWEDLKAALGRDPRKRDFIKANKLYAWMAIRRKIEAYNKMQEVLSEECFSKKCRVLIRQRISRHLPDYIASIKRSEDEAFVRQILRDCYRKLGAEKSLSILKWLKKKEQSRGKGFRV